MICPECGDEFREGFFRCPDCNVPLAPVVPEAAPPNHPESVELVRTANVPFLTVVKSLLDAESIPYSVQGEEALGLVTVLPSFHFGSPDAVGARLFVPEDRLEEAQALVQATDLAGDV